MHLLLHLVGSTRCFRCFGHTGGEDLLLWEQACHSRNRIAARRLTRVDFPGLLLLASALFSLFFENPVFAQALYVGDNFSYQTINFTSGTNNFNATYIGYNSSDSNNVLNIANTNTLLTNSGDLIVGFDGSGNNLVISNGATVESGSSSYGGVIGLNADSSNNSVLVTGTGSLWSNNGALTVGYSGNATLSVTSGGTVDASGIVIAARAGSVGTVNFGTLGGSDTNITLITPFIDFGSGSGTLNFNQADTAIITSTISGYGTLDQIGSGTTILTASNTYTGSTFIDSGTLLVNGVVIGQGGSAIVSSGATLGGSGLFAQDVTVNGVGGLASSLEIFGQLTLPDQVSLGSVTNGTTTTLTNTELLITSAIGGTINSTSATASIGTLNGSTLVLGNWGATVTNLVSGIVITSGGGLVALQGNFTGTISGSGGLVKKGAGTLTLLSSNSYTGPTIISSGVLQVGYGVNSGSLGKGRVVDNGLLILDNSSSLNLGSGVSGNGSIVQIGTGTTTLAGSNSYSGATLIDGGTLILTGSITGNNELKVGISNNLVSLDILNGSYLNSSSGVVGLIADSSNNSVLVTGKRSLWSNNGDLIVGLDGSGNSLVISNGGVVASSQYNYGGVVGLNADSTNNSVLVMGTNSLWNNSGDLIVGLDGSGNSLVISNGGVVTNSQYNYGGVLGLNADSTNNSVLVTGTNSIWNNSGDLIVGLDGSGNTLVISNGGVVTNSQYNYGGVLGLNADSTNNSVLVTGTNSIWNNSGDLLVGYDGYSNSLVISNGGIVATSQYNYGGVLGLNADSSNNSVLVTGTNSLWNDGGDLIVGFDGSRNSLVISNGGVVTTSQYDYGGVIGLNADSSNNSVLVTGTASLWSNNGALTVGYGGSATLSVASGGTVDASGIVIAARAGSVGTVNFGTLGGSDTNITLITPSIAFGSGSGTLNFNQADSATITSTISGIGSILQLGTGTTILSASNSFSGSTSVNSGKLLINSNGCLAGGGTVTVAPSGTLLNNGMIAGTTIANGTLGGNGGNFNNLKLNGGSSLIWNILNFAGTAGTNWDVLNVRSLNLSSLNSTSPFTIYVQGTSGTGLTKTNFSFDFLNITSSVTGFAASDFIVNTSLFIADPNLSGGVWSVGTNSFSGVTELNLTYAVPEPASSSLLGMGALLLLICACRHRICWFGCLMIDRRHLLFNLIK